MTKVAVQAASEKAQRLIKIFREIGETPIPTYGVEGGVRSIQEILESLATPGNASDPEVIERSIAGAGIHDLAAKITTVWDGYPTERAMLAPHLRLLARTYHVAQNTDHERWDRIDGEPREHGAADKVIELYFACLCLLAHMSVELDDPFTSSKGANPDVIATAADGTRWAFALKTQSRGNPRNRAINLADLLNGAAKQILRARCDKGVAVVNLKNVIDHARLRASGAYARWEDARDALESQVDAILEEFHQTHVATLNPAFTQKGVLAPVVFLIAHTTVLCLAPGATQPAFTEIKSMKARMLPQRRIPEPGTYAAEVTALARVFNDLVQRQI